MNINDIIDLVRERLGTEFFSVVVRPGVRGDLDVTLVAHTGSGLRISYEFCIAKDETDLFCDPAGRLRARLETGVDALLERIAYNIRSHR